MTDLLTRITQNPGQCGGRRIKEYYAVSLIKL